MEDTVMPEISIQAAELQAIPVEHTSLGEVARGLHTTARLVQLLHAEVKEFAINQATAKLTLTTIEESLRELRKNLSTTEPTSLVVRLIVIEQEIQALKAWKAERIHYSDTRDIEEQRHSWQLKMAVGSSVVALLGSAVLNILSWVLKH